MSEQSMGPGWWLASDGRWYPPESRPSARPADGDVPPESSIKGCGEALSGLGCALTIVGFGILAVVLLLILVV
jgi:hypothetical protein